MRDKLPSHPLSRKGRPEYGPVPLEPWTAVEPKKLWSRGKSETYMAASTERIRGRVALAMADAVDVYDWAGSPELAEELRGVIEVSLYDSHRRRMELNPGSLLRGAVDETDPRAERAREGTASPAELLTLLVDYPKLSSIELAKLSHPLDGTATETMDGEVMYSLACLGFEFADNAGRYKTKTLRPDIPAATILRKRTVGELATGEGYIQVVERKAFLVRGDDEARAENDIHLDRLVKNQDRHSELYEKIESWHPYAQQLPANWERSRKWLQPLATSYYAKYIDEARIDGRA